MGTNSRTSVIKPSNSSGVRFLHWIPTLTNNLLGWRITQTLPLRSTKPNLKRSNVKFKQKHPKECLTVLERQSLLLTLTTWIKCAKKLVYTPEDFMCQRITSTITHRKVDLLSDGLHLLKLH